MCQITNKKSVRFSVIEIREYEITLGDHPGLSLDGPSLSLGWSYNISKDMSIEEYEEQRTIRGNRSRSEMILPAFSRELLLLDFGYSRTQMRNSLQDRANILEKRKRNQKISKQSIIRFSLRNIGRSKKKTIKIEQ